MAMKTNGRHFWALTGLLLAAAGSLGATPKVIAKPVCADVSDKIYFETDESKMTRQVKTSLKLLVQSTKGCTVMGATVTGLSADPGGSAQNLTLSQDRANTVLDNLRRLGLRKVDVQVLAKGDVDDENSKGQERPMRRRVDVVLRLAPPTHP